MLDKKSARFDFVVVVGSSVVVIVGISVVVRVSVQLTTTDIPTTVDMTYVHTTHDRLTELWW